MVFSVFCRTIMTQKDERSQHLLIQHPKSGLYGFLLLLLDVPPPPPHAWTFRSLHRHEPPKRGVGLKQRDRYPPRASFPPIRPKTHDKNPSRACVRAAAPCIPAASSAWEQLTKTLPETRLTILETRRLERSTSVDNSAKAVWGSPRKPPKKPPSVSFLPPSLW